MINWKTVFVRLILGLLDWVLVRYIFSMFIIH